MANSVYYEYALALFSLSNLEENYQCLKDFESILKNKEYYSFFSSPNIENKEKKEVIKNSYFEVSEDLVNLLYVLIDNERLLEVDKIIASFENILNEKRNIISFTLETAYSLKEETINEIKKSLEIKYHKNVVLNVLINKDIIGGLVLRQNGQIIDASVLSKLEGLKESLKEMRN